MLTEKELMFGDWVMYNPNVFIEDEYEPAKDWFPTWINSGEQIELAIEGCYAPIPITTEILEKNGFEYDQYCYNWIYDKFTINVGHLIVDEEVSDYLFIVVAGTSVKLTYVHELQHALRLCGQNDLADNFKI